MPVAQQQTMDDERQSYDEMMEVASRLTKYCRCCPICRDHPCGGVLQGALCDEMPCMCEDSEDIHWEDED